MTILLGIIFAPLLPFWAYALYRELARIRATRVADDIARIEAGFASWTDPTPAQPLRAIAWPVRQSPTDVEDAYGPVPWTDPDWPITELLRILAVNRLYDRALERAAA